MSPQVMQRLSPSDNLTFNLCHKGVVTFSLLIWEEKEAHQIKSVQCFEVVKY